MKRLYPTWPRFVIALSVAVALIVAWGFVSSIVMGMVQLQTQRSVDYVHDALQIGRDGTPVIESTHYASFGVDNSSMRTLDGQPWQGKIVEDGGVTLAAPRKLSNSANGRISWSERVVGASDSQRRGTSWYLVREDDPLGPAYFEGYDELTSGRVGYIGRGGFRQTQPPREEWFDLPPRRFGLNGNLYASSGYLALGTRASSYFSTYEKTPPPEEGIQPWQIFLIDGNRLLEVDLRTRGVRAVYEKPNLFSVAILHGVPAKKSPAGENQANDAAAAGDDSTEATTVVMANGQIVKVGAFVSLLVLRTEDRIVVLNPTEGTSREFLLPAELRQKDLTPCLVPGDDLLVVVYEKSIDARLRAELTWLAADGTVMRRESTALARNEMSRGTGALMGACMAPFPLAWLPMVGLSFTEEAARDEPGISYAEAVGRSLAHVWPVLSGVTALAIVLAGLTYRLQRKYHRSATGGWCAFVFLLGVPGFLAYLIEQRKPKLESCPACKATVPRDREACAACHTMFPLPLRLGTEVFA